MAVGADHAGFALKEYMKEYLDQPDLEVIDLGCDSVDSCDYPEFAHAVAQAVEKGTADAGILVCGTGIGMSMAANRHKNIRAALCCDVEQAKMSRAHNDANVLCLGGRFISQERAVAIADAFLSTPFEGGRHKRRVDKI